MDVRVICDLQFGSTGKGLIAGHLARTVLTDSVVSAWGPNAGHTFVSKETGRVMHTMLPIGAYSRHVTKAFIGPGAMINADSLLMEYIACVGYRYRNNFKNLELIIHPHACIVTDTHKGYEKTLNSIGSTQKGSAEAAIQKIRRQLSDSNLAVHMLPNNELGKYLAKSPADYIDKIGRCENIQVEAAQGYSLSLHHGFWPYTTGRDTSTYQVLADCGIPMGMVGDIHVVGCARTFPIRVANRFDADGNMVGFSGPCYDDQLELNWETLGIEPELTTVTKLPRRLFTFSVMQIREAVKVMGVTSIFLNFANYCASIMELRQIEQSIEEADAQVSWLGIGSDESDILPSYEFDRLVCNGRHKWSIK